MFVMATVLNNEATTPPNGPTPVPDHHGAVAAVPHTQVHRYLRRFLETAQDVAIVILMLLLIGITGRALWHLFELAFLRETPFAVLLSEVVFVLILTEVYRTLVFYLREHRVSVALVVEVAIVSVVQELILRAGEHEFQLERVLGMAVILLVLGALLVMQRYVAHVHNDASDTSAH